MPLICHLSKSQVFKIHAFDANWVGRSAPQITHPKHKVGANHELVLCPPRQLVNTHQQAKLLTHCMQQAVAMHLLPSQQLRRVDNTEKEAKHSGERGKCQNYCSGNSTLSWKLGFCRSAAYCQWIKKKLYLHSVFH